MRSPGSLLVTDVAMMRIFRPFEAAPRGGMLDALRRPDHNQCSGTTWRRHVGDKTLSENDLRRLHRDGAKCT